MSKALARDVSRRPHARSRVDAIARARVERRHDSSFSTLAFKSLMSPIHRPARALDRAPIARAPSGEETHRIRVRIRRPRPRRMRRNVRTKIDRSIFPRPRPRARARAPRSTTHDARDSADARERRTRSIASRAPSSTRRVRRRPRARAHGVRARSSTTTDDARGRMTWTLVRCNGWYLMV